MLKFEISDISFKDRESLKLYEKVNDFLCIDKQDNPIYYLDHIFKIKGERLQLLSIMYVYIPYINLYYAKLTMLSV